VYGPDSSPQQDSGGAWFMLNTTGKTKLLRWFSAIARASARATFTKLDPKGKGHIDFSIWPFNLMPATTYSPTHFRVQYNRPGGA
jgi:hypothetical protein